MVEPSIRIESDRAQGHCPRTDQKRVGIRQQCVDRIRRGTSIALLKIKLREAVVVAADHRCEVSEISRGGVSFCSQQALQVAGTLYRAEILLETVSDRVEALFTLPV